MNELNSIAEQFLPFINQVNYGNPNPSIRIFNSMTGDVTLSNEEILDFKNFRITRDFLPKVCDYLAIESNSLSNEWEAFLLNKANSNNVDLESDSLYFSFGFKDQQS